MWDRTKSVFKKNSGGRNSRNVRKSVWKPSPAPNLLERAHTSLIEEKRRKIPQASKIAKGTLSLKNSQKSLESSSALPSSLAHRSHIQPRADNHKPENQTHDFFKDKTVSDPSDFSEDLLFQSNHSDTADNILIPKEEPKADKNSQTDQFNEVLFSHQALDEPSYSSTGVWLRGLMIGLLLITPIVAYFIEPWLWQWQRLHQTLPVVPVTDAPVIMLVGDNQVEKQTSEEQFFRGVSRLLHSDASAIGFFRSPYQWLPNPSDPLQYEHLNQLLERFPHVVVGLEARVHDTKRQEQDTSFLAPKNLMQLPIDDFSRLRWLDYQVESEALLKLLPQINVGFIKPVDTGLVFPIDELGMHQVLARVRLDSIDSKVLGASSQLQVSPSFASMVSIIAKGLRPAQFRTDHAWFKRTITSNQTSISLRSDGVYAPPLETTEPEVIAWQDWLSGKKEVALSGRPVIIGQLGQQRYLPDPARALALDWQQPIGHLQTLPELWWQAHLIAHLQAGLGQAVPNFLQQLIAAWFIVCVLVGISMFNQNFIIPLMGMTIAITAGVSWWSPTFSLWSFAGLALLMLPLLMLWSKLRHRVLPIKKENALAQERTMNIGVLEDDEYEKLFDTNSGAHALKESVPLFDKSSQHPSPSKKTGHQNHRPDHTPAIEQNIFNQTDDHENLGSTLFFETQVPPSTPSSDDATEKQAVRSQPVQQSLWMHKTSSAAENLLQPTAQEMYPFVDGDTLEEDPTNLLEQQKRQAQEVVSSIVSSPESSYSKESRRVNTQGFNNLLVDHLQAGEADNESRIHLGRYQVERVLGKGAMGVVYLGLDPHINRRVAIKTVPLPEEAKQGENEQLTARFFREAQAAGKLTHPSIVTIYDAGLYENHVYIAMEYLEGLDLSNFIDPKRLLPVSTVINLIARVAEGLHFAHERGVVHRDIKPANIIFDSAHNIIKVTDFGIAHIHDSNRAMTQVLVGSPNYMSPEHLTGEQLDGRSDLFSLAVTLYVLCCGHTPFAAENVSQLMYSILNDPPRDIRQFRPELTKPVVAIINRALQKNRKDRYSSGASMAQDLLISLRP